MRRLEVGSDRGHEVGDGRAEEVGDRDVRGEIDAQLLRAAELGDERVEGRAVERERDVEEHEASTKSSTLFRVSLPVPGRAQRRGRHGTPKGMAAPRMNGMRRPRGLFSAIRLGGDERVDEAVEEPATGRDDTDDREPRKHGALGDEDRHALARAWSSLGM
jgi:hypothetical protein